MSNRVVDASVACKWFFDEQFSAQAREIVASGDELCAPDILLSECANVAIRQALLNRTDLSKARQLITVLQKMFDAVVPSSELVYSAMEMAHTLWHPIYDCIYLALAQREDTKVITADLKFVRKVGQSKWKRHVEYLGDLR